MEKLTHISPTERTTGTTDHLTGLPVIRKIYTAKREFIQDVEVNREILLGTRKELQEQLDNIDVMLALMPEEDEPIA